MYHVQISTGCLSSHWGIKPATFAERYAVSIYSPDCRLSITEFQNPTKQKP